MVSFKSTEHLEAEESRDIVDAKDNAEVRAADRVVRLVP